MNRRTGILAVLVLVSGAALGCSQHGGIQPPATPRALAAVEEATRLDVLVEKLYGEGKFQEAILLSERSLALREQALGPRHPGVAESLNDLGALHEAQGSYSKAEPLFIRALDIREKALGATHPDVAESLNNLAILYKEQGVYSRAEPFYIRALDIREKVLGAMHPDVAESLNNLAVLYQTQGAYARAEPLLVRALGIWEKALGTMHPDVAVSLNNLALLYQAQGAYARAEPLLVQALDIREKVLGAMHPDVATSLDNLAMLYKAQGAYTRAEPLLVRAFAIREKVLGAMHPDVAISLNNLAAVYQDQGAYARAEPLYVRALDIWEKILGTMHPTVATSLNNLAVLYSAQGAYAQAEPRLVRALDIREQVLGAMHPDVALSLNNLADLYKMQGAYARAEPLLVRALDIREKALGAMHPDVAGNLNSLAMLYYAQGTYERAEPLFIQARDVREKVLGAMHPDVAVSLNNLANLYQAQGAYARAEPLYVRALNIGEKALGTMHPSVAETLNNLARLYQAQGEYAGAEHLRAQAAELRETYLRAELPRLSESRKRELMSLLQKETQQVISLQVHAMPSSPQALELALTTILRRKGLVLDSLADTQATLRGHLTPQLRDKLAQLADASTQLSMRLRAPFNPHTAKNQKSEIASLRVRIDDLEAELNKASVEFRVQAEPVTIAKIQAALPRGSALVELVRYRRYDVQAQAQRWWKEERYLAYLLFEHGSPQWVELGDAARIDAGVNATVAAMYKDASANAAKVALRHLDALIFAPVRDRLAGVSHVIVSPDGKLNLVPFAALIDPQGHYALEQRLISYVTSGRDLLRLATRQASRSPATIVAAPAYGPPRSADLNGLGTFRPLEGTSAELVELPAYFVQARTLTGDQATKAALAATVGPAVLHISTHGFYAPSATTTPSWANISTGLASSTSTHPASATPQDSQRGIYVDGDPFSALPPPPPSEDPTEALDRAGLAMAGANLSPDGIVSARELASYDWWGTQLVVLSACETGVGAVPSGEGVYGMRRALVLAGAESQVVSLWNVSDASTRELMRAFYGELARGTGRAEALRRAKLRLLRQPQFAHPYYWAAFIPAGDWTPLDPHLLKREEHGQ